MLHAEIKRKYIEANELVSVEDTSSSTVLIHPCDMQCGNVIKVCHHAQILRIEKFNRVQVTPSSKVVGDFAQWMTSNKFSKQDVIDRASELDFPSSVVEFFQGYLGQPVGGFPEPLRSNIIRNKPRIDGRPGATMEPLDFKKIKAELRSKFGKHITDTDVTSYVMYPKVSDELRKI
jgi:pyruvate carboxylase